MQVGTSDAKISLTSIPISGFYKMKSNGQAILLFGGGIGFYLITEELSVELYNGDEIHVTLDKNEIGFQIFSEIEFPINPVIRGFTRLNYSTATIKGEGGVAGNKVDIGGFSLMGGLRF